MMKVEAYKINRVSRKTRFLVKLDFYLCERQDNGADAQDDDQHPDHRH